MSYTSATFNPSTNLLFKSLFILYIPKPFFKPIVFRLSVDL
nr:MAG TPA: hypothetical protein [Caudoviricetes sp.]